MEYQVVRMENSKNVALMNCDFEDEKQFKLIALSPQYKILCDGKDITKKYRRKEIVKT